MKLMSIASALNVRLDPKGPPVYEMLAGDLLECDSNQLGEVWVTGTILTGLHAGKSGYVRRKWLVQYFDTPPALAARDRTEAARIVAARTTQFDPVRYGLGKKAKNFTELDKNGIVDCSGWVYLLGKEIMAAYAPTTKPGFLSTFSDEQITSLGKKTGAIISSKWLTRDMFAPGCLVGLDFAEYSWDRNRPLDIDHIVIIGADEGDLFVSQSSSGGGGVNRVAFEKWFQSTQHLLDAGRMHLVDLLAL